MENSERGLSQYEQIKISEMHRHASGTAIAGLVVGVGAAVLAIGAAAWAGSRAKSARDVADANNAGTAALLNRLATQYDQYFAAERAERINGDTNISQTITDTISGQQQGSQSQSQTTSVDNTISQIMTQTLADAITGRSSLNPTPVNIYSAPQPCGCPGGCGGR